MVLPDQIEAPDLYARGDSLEEWAEDVLDTVGNGQLIIAGCSMGGSCTLEVAHMAPDRVSAQVLAQRTEDRIRVVCAFHSRRDLSKLAAIWNKPLLVMCGDKDRVVTESKTAEFVAGTPFGTMHVMRDCGHYMNMERPSVFNRIIGDFVELVDSSVSCAW